MQNRTRHTTNTYALGKPDERGLRAVFLSYKFQYGFSLNYKERNWSAVRPTQCDKLPSPSMPGVVAAVAAVARDPGKNSDNEA